LTVPGRAETADCDKAQPAATINPASTFNTGHCGI
jgi:hypothetical protein